MKLYVANGTHQNVDFQYRVQDSKSYRQQTISVGGQVKLSGDLDSVAIGSIISSHAKYGMVEAKEISKFKGFHIPYIYSVDEPISFEQIAELVSQNRSVKNQQGVQIRQEAALAVNNIIEDQVPGDTLTNLELTVEEITKNKDSEMHEGVRVTRDEKRGAPQGYNKKSKLGF